MSAPGTKPAAIRVLIIDDDLFVRELLSEHLTAEPDIEVVGTCSDGGEALDAVARLRPQVILMDMRMPTVDGATATREVSRTYPQVKVIALTSFGDDDAIGEMFDSGVSGFLLKSTRPSAMASAIRAATSGITVVPSDAMGRWRRSRATGPKPHLEPLEWDVLGCLDEGLTNRQITQELFVSTSVVKRCVNSLMLKLEASTRTQVVARAHALGLLPRPASDSATPPPVQN